MGNLHGVMQTPDLEGTNGISPSQTLCQKGHELCAHTVFTWLILHVVLLSPVWRPYPASQEETGK